MGNSQSSSTDPRFASAAREFTRKELENLRSLFASLAAQSRSNGKYISLDVFKAYIGIDGPLGLRVFDLVTQRRGDQKLTFEDLVIAKGTYEKGTKEDIEEFIYHIADISSNGEVSRSDLEVVVSSILANLFKKIDHGFETETPLEIIEAFMNAASFTNDSLSMEEFQRWCTLIPASRKYLSSLLMPYDSGSHVPRLQYVDNINRSHVLLREEYAWHIGGALSTNEHLEWKLQYHSLVHGQSFNTFLGNMQNDGPTVFIIKDSEGCIYGGYASQPWERHSDFYGDMRSFLFQLYPKTSIFRPTGANHNLQWCAVNFSSDSIPNGIGFGGRVNHFGLFVSANFDKGHTFPCVTFGSPCLSKNNQINPQVIECWRVMQPKADQSKSEALKGTVLERFKEERSMLNLVGIANSSE